MEKKPNMVHAQKPKVLIVDDEPFIGELLEEFLKERFDTTVFEDATSALESFKDNDFDLVVSDLKMPKISGNELARKMKEIKSNIPIVIITGHTNEREMGEMKNIEAVLTKPFENQKTVIETLENCLN